MSKKSIAMPSVEELRLAALWCDSNEGDEGEQAPLKRVAQWLDQQADVKELREAAAENGVPVGALRLAMKRAERQS